MITIHTIWSQTINVTAMPVTVLLGGLILFALWVGRTSYRGGLAPLLVSFSAFIVSRLLSPPVGSVVGFAILNFFGYVAIAWVIASLGADTEEPVAGEAADGDVAEDAAAHIPRPVASVVVTVLKQSGYLALVGIVVFLAAGNYQGSFRAFAAGLMSFALMGATIRLIAFAFEAARRCPTALRVATLAGLGLLSASWLILAVTPVLVPGMLAAMTALSRTIDVATMVFVLAGLISEYVRMGSSLRDETAASRIEMETAQAELAKLSNLASNIYEDSSDVIKKQKEQTLQFMKKVESLEKILQIGITIQNRQQLDEVLPMVVEMVRDYVGFKTVILRLLNPATQNFETEAYVGLSEDVRETVVNYRIPAAEYKKMIKPQSRISKSYLICNDRTWQGESLGEGTMLVEDTWGEIDMLIVPLQAEEQTTIGYLSVENPENPKLSVADVIETLENIAVLAAVAIRNARFFRELEAKNRKLSTYAEKLSSVNKMKSNFVATISHEFRTPLTSIKAYCETLLKNADEVDRELLKQFLIVIDEESSRLMTLIDDILDFSQLESGAMKFERKPSDLLDVVDSAVKELEKNYELKQVTLHQELPPSQLVMHVDSELIKQLLVNLLHNASKFTKENGNVWLKIKDEANAVHIVVQDDGIGIPETQLGQVFEEFHQADNSSTRKYGGTGLGLAICKNIVEWHDGRIWVENVAGRGARFVAVIPKKEVVVKCHVTSVSSTVRRFEIERFLELLVEATATFAKARRASIMLLDRKNNELCIECAIGLDEEIVAKARVKVGEGIAGRVAESGRTLLVTDIERDSRTERSNNELIYGSKAFLSVPIKAGEEVMGVINVASPMGRDQFRDEDAQLLETLAERIGVALVKLHRFANSSVSYEQVREAFKSILEARRYIDRKDDHLVNRWVIATADKLGMTDEQKARLKYVLGVYDLGLSKVGYHIIKKPHDLSPNDREEIEKHTIIGRDLLESIETAPEVGEIVLRHHENFDGTGYPDHLGGDQIPLESRILRVSDSLRALISRRPYQRQYSLDEAKEVLKHRSGTFFDPRVVNAFVEAMDELTSDGSPPGDEQPGTHDEALTSDANSSKTPRSDQ